MSNEIKNQIILEDGKSTPCNWCSEILLGSLEAQKAHCAMHGITKVGKVYEQNQDGKDHKILLVHPSVNV